MWAWLVAFFGAIQIFITYGVLGAFAAGAGYLATRFIGGGLLAAIVIGGVIVGGVSSTDYFQNARNANAKAQIASLKNEKAALERDLEASRVSKEELTKAIFERDKVIEHNAGVMAELDEVLAARGEKPECALSDEEMRILNELR